MLALVALNVADHETGVVHLGSPPLGGNRRDLRKLPMSAKLLTHSRPQWAILGSYGGDQRRPSEGSAIGSRRRSERGNACHDAAPNCRRVERELKMAKKRSKTAGDKLRDRLSEAKSRFQGRTPRTRTRKRPQPRRLRRKW